jgi:hypothetical protein
VYQSPFEFIVQPGSVVSTSCVANGAGLQVATAGKASQFTINSVDQFGNSRGVGGDSFSVHIYSKEPLKRPDQGSTVDNTDSSYSVEYTTFIAGEVGLSVLQVIGEFLMCHFVYTLASDVIWQRGALQRLTIHPHR